MGIEIEDYIRFQNFNSKSEGLFLLDRSAPSPEEKEIVKDIPFKQGILDFSMLLGERVFKNREITYTFLLLDRKKTDIFKAETRIKQKLMRYGEQRLYDTHDEEWYWLGKCKSVKAERDDKYSRLKVTVVFDCYPFMLSYDTYFDDCWDDFRFDEDIANYTKYNVNGKLTFNIYNNGYVSTKPKITTTSSMKVTIGDNSATFSAGSSNSTDYYLSLKPGTNKVTVEGNGTIRFRWTTEVLG